MEKVIIIRYGEIFLKGKNRDYFESLLIRNIKDALKGITYKFTRSQSRYFIENYAEDDEAEIIDRVTKVFGIHSLSVADKLPTDEENDFKEIREDIRARAKALYASNTKPNPTFRVTCKRADKKLKMNSAEIAASLGGDVLEVARFTVALSHFDYEFLVDIRENGHAFVYSDVIKGAGGLPVGSSARGLALLSGGIDSPVAAYMMAKRGMHLTAIHFSSPPYTSEKAKEKVVELRDIVAKYATDIKLIVVPFTDIQLAIHKDCPSEFMITIMRRFMMRIATRIAEDNHCGAIVTGESLGQVASQTVESITCTGSVTSMPVFRPLIGFDKDEIMDIAKRIGTFDTSILPYEDCCTIFLPKQPAIKPKLDVVVEAEQKIANADELIEQAIANIEVL